MFKRTVKLPNIQQSLEKSRQDQRHFISSKKFEFVNIYSPRNKKFKDLERSPDKPKELNLPIKKNHSRNQLQPVIARPRLVPGVDQHQCPRLPEDKLKKLKFKVHLQTKGGCQVGGIPKTNQDNFIVQQLQGQDFFGVCDGHGTNGHFVSKFLRNNIPKNLLKALRSKEGQDEKSSIARAFDRAFVQTNQMLFQQNFDTFFSGSTLVTVLIGQKELSCANVGDSRSILVSYINNKYNIVQLSIDQKPCYQPQKERILKAGGRIDNQRDQKGRPIGPLRVWLSKIRIPGLAMTRSFGDKAGTQAGMIANPVVRHYTLQSQDSFIIIASDGLWQFLQNQQIVNAIVPYYQRRELRKGTKHLLQMAQDSWSRNSTVRDDITIMVIQLRDP